MMALLLGMPSWVFPDQASDLMSFYDAAGGSDWDDNSDWDSGDPCTNSWFGVSCNGGHVVTLDLNNNNLVGTLAPELFSLTTLSELKLIESPGLSGSLPLEVGQLTALATLDLTDGSAMSGTLPEQLLQCTELMEIRISGSLISGTLPDMSALTRLEHVTAQSKQLSGTIPAGFQAQTALLGLRIGRYISGTIPASLAALTRLADFQILAPVGQEDGPVIMGLVSGSIPTALQAWTALTTLHVSQQSLSGTIPAEIGALTTLITLEMDRVPEFSGTIPTELGLLTSLTALVTGGYMDMHAFTTYQSRISGVLPTQLSACTQLETLKTEFASISGTLPEAFLPATSSLQALRILSTNISGTAPVALAALTLLKQLRVSPRMSGTVPATLLSLTGLDELVVGNNAPNRMSGTIPSSLSAMTRIQAFQLSQSRVSGTLPSELGTWTSLTGWNLGETRISGTLASELVTLPQLQNFLMVRAFLSGSMPTALSTNTRLQQLHFGGNRISGTIPDLSLLTGLSEILLFSNRLSGTVPPLSHLVNLGRLILDDQRLSGTFPSLSQCPELAILGFGNNPALAANMTAISNPALTVLLAQNTSSHGHFIPDAFTDSRVVLLSDTKCSGTIPDSFGTHTSLEKLDFSNTMISGTLPRSLSLLTTLNTLMANNLRLSGSLPPSSTWVSNLEVLSLSRNFLTGNTSTLEVGNNLTTLVLSSNHFECNVAGCNGASSLSVGRFKLPEYAALHTVGLQLEQNTYEISFNPMEYEGPEYYRSNMVLTVPGNAALRAGAGHLPENPASNVVRTDEVVQGRMEFFSGQSQFRYLFWMFGPLMLVFHILTVIYMVGIKGCRDYLFHVPSRSEMRGTLWRFVCSQYSLACGLAVLGVGALVTNVVHDNQQCRDMFLSTSFVSFLGQATKVQQWIWVVIASASMTCISVSCHHTFRGEAPVKKRMLSAYRIICRLLESTSAPLPRSIAVWRDQAFNSNRDAQESWWWRAPVYWLLHVPLCCFAAIPAFGFVLGQNSPSSENKLAVLTSSPLMVATLNSVFGVVVIPVASRHLARLRHGGGRFAESASSSARSLSSSRLTSRVILTLFQTILAPILSVALLDEACMRYYLNFNPELQALLASWRIAMTGFEALRTGFCLRRLITEFAYVWTTEQVIELFAAPSVQLILAWVNASDVVEKLKSKVSRIRAKDQVPVEPGDVETDMPPLEDLPPPALKLDMAPPLEIPPSPMEIARETRKERLEALEVTMSETMEVEDSISSGLAAMGTAAIFGLWLPTMTILTLLIVHLRSCMLRHLSKNMLQRNIVTNMVGDVFSQFNPALFLAISRAGLWGVAGFTFVDYSFSWPPVISFGVFCVAEIMASLLTTRNLVPPWVCCSNGANPQDPDFKLEPCPEVKDFASFSQKKCP